MACIMDAICKFLRVVRRIALFSLLAGFVAAPKAAGAATFELGETMLGIPVGHYIDVALSPSAETSPDSILAQADAFRPLDMDWVALGPVSGSVWLRFSAHNPGNTVIAWDLDLHIPLSEHIRLYEIRDGSVQPEVAPRFVPFPAFRLRADPQETRNYLLQIDMQSPHLYRVKAWSPTEFASENRNQSVRFGMLSGFIAMAVLVVLIFMVAFRDWAGLCYSLFFLAAFLRLLLDAGYFNWLPDPLRMAGPRLMYFVYTFLMLVIIEIGYRAFPVMWGGLRLARLLRFEQLVLVVTACAVLVSGSVTIVTSVMLFVMTLTWPSLGIAAIMAIIQSRKLDREAAFSVDVDAAMILLSLPAGYALHFINLGWSSPSSFCAFIFPILPIVIAIVFTIAYAIRVRMLFGHMLDAERALNELRRQKIEELETIVENRTSAYRQAKEHAERMTEARQELLRTVAHDLRSPMSAILLSVERLRLSANGQSRTTLDTIGTVVHHMIDRTDTLLRLESAQDARIPIFKQHINLFELAEKEAASLEPLASAKGIAIENLIPAEYRIFGDARILGQIISNLLGNSIKFCRSGDRIRVAIDDHGDLTISDTGPGIPKMDIADLFSPKHSHRLGSAGELGYGVGLVGCKQLISAHGGSIRYIPTEISGTTFALSFG